MKLCSKCKNPRNGEELICGDRGESFVKLCTTCRFLRAGNAGKCKNCGASLSQQRELERKEARKRRAEKGASLSDGNITRCFNQYVAGRLMAVSCHPMPGCCLAGVMLGGDSGP